MQPLLDCATPRPRLSAGIVGAGRRRRAGRRPRRLAQPVGGVMSSRHAPPPPRAERGDAVAVPADRGLRLPVRLPHRRAPLPRRRRRLAVRPPLRRAQRVRHAARPRGRASSGWRRSASTSRRRAPTSRAPTSSPPPGTRPGAGSSSRTRSRWAPAPATTPSPPTPGRRPTTTPTICWSGPPTASTAEVEIDLVCEPVFDYGRTAASWTLVDGDRHAADATGAGVTLRLATDMALGIEGGRARARHVLGPGDRVVRPVLGRGPRRAGDVDDAARRASPPQCSSGATGCDGPGARPPLAAGASSARRWPSRASPTCRPGRPWRRSPRPCRRRRTASATGTTATRGCATRRSPSRPCTTSTSTGRPTSSCSSSPSWSRSTTAASRSCTASTAGGI